MAESSRDHGRTVPRAAGLARRVTRLTARLTYREIEVVAVGDAPPGPAVLVSNHFGGVADALLLGSVTNRFPRIVARDLIWKYPVARQIMTAIGAIPVHRRADTAGGKPDNDAMFASCYQALADGSLVLIFPEGVTQDVPYLAPVKSGAARIALGAVASGVDEVTVQAAGIHYEDKAAFRSRVLVAFGGSLPVSATTGYAGAGSGDRAAVAELTAAMETGLRQTAPDYSDWDQAADLQLAASTTLRELGSASERVDAVPLAMSEPIASVLATLPREAQQPVREAARAHRDTLRSVHLSDAMVSSRGHARSGAGGALLRNLLLALVMTPFALLGVVFAAIPYLLTQATRLIPAAPAVRATIMPIVALLVFMAQWISVSVAAGVQDGWGAGALVALLVPAFIGATVVVAERLVLSWRIVVRRVTRRLTTPRLQDVRATRSSLVDAVRTALAQVSPL